VNPIAAVRIVMVIIPARWSLFLLNLSASRPIGIAEIASAIGYKARIIPTWKGPVIRYRGNSMVIEPKPIRVRNTARYR
jgi:hypothetical protein